MTAKHLETVKDLHKVLLDLESTSSPLWKDGIDINGKKLRKHTIKNFEKLHIPRISGGELSDYISNNRNRTSIKLDKRIYLPPLEYNCKDNAFIPTLHLDFNLGKNIIKLFLEMYRLHEISQEEGWRMHGFGFRFENPHEGSGHDYWHMQITRVHSSALFPEWVPQNTPCFAMKALDPISLLCSMLICLYGSTGFSKRILPCLRIDGEYLRPISDILGKTEHA